MVTLISFFFLLFFATLFSILFSYFIMDDDKDNINVALIAILGALISFILDHNIGNGNPGITYGLGLFSVIYLSKNFIGSFSEAEDLLLFFPGIIGLLIGFGFIFEVIVLMFFLYMVRSSFGRINSQGYSDEDEYEV